MDGWMDQCIDGWVNQMIYESMDRWIYRWIDGSIDVLIDGSIVRWFDGSMDQLIGGLVDGRESQRECVWEIEIEDFFIVGGRSTPFEISQMVRNVNVNVKVDSCFTLSCELVGRLPNLKLWIFSTAHMPGR